MKTWALRFVFCALLAIGLSLTAAAQTAPGVIKAGKVQGDVFRLTADGQSLPVKAGDNLIETDTVRTAKGASVVLVFMNGSSVKLGSDSKLKIEEFKMDPLGEDIAVAKLEAEPSKSKTALDLAYGEMIGDVKKLNTESSYNIKTPVGAAGIRGTQFRIVFRPSGDGRTFTFQLSTAEGRVVFEGTVAAPANVSVPANEELVVTAEVTVNPQTGDITVQSTQVPPTTQPISNDATQTITTATAEQQAVVEATIITVAEQQAAAATTPSSSDSSSSSSTSSETKKEETTSTETKSNDTTSSEAKSTDTTTPASQTPTNPTTTTQPKQTNNPPPTSTPKAQDLTPGAG